MDAQAYGNPYGIDFGTISLLADAARRAQKNAHAPYSRFRVGCAVLASSQVIYLGANVENASYGLTICAERAALASAITLGERVIKAVALIGDTSQPLAPCGACRQWLVELAPSALIIMLSATGDMQFSSVDDLLPNAFTPALLP